MVFTLGDMVALGVAVFTVVGGVAGTIIWAYSTFITRTEAKKMEEAVDRIIAEFRRPINIQLEKFEKKMDEFIKAAS